MNTPEIKLAPPGAGLPFFETLVGKYWILPWGVGRTDWEGAVERFKREVQRILKLIEPLSAGEMEKKVLIRRIPGMEDSSRYWSVAMTLEHLMITNQGMTTIAVELSHGRLIPFKVDTAKVKPSGLISGKDAAAKFKSLAETSAAQLMQNTGDRKSRSTHDHPWFGAMTTRKWLWLIGQHQALHRKQIEEILRTMREAP